MACRWQLRVVHEVVEWSENQRERRAQLMGDVGEEAEAFLVQVLLLLTVAPLQLERSAQCQLVLVSPHEPYSPQHDGGGIEQEGPPGEPEGWGDGHFELCLPGFIPVLAAQFGPEHKSVVSWPETAEHHVVVVAYVVPFIVHALHHVGKLYVFRLSKIAHVEGHAQRVALVRGAYAAFLVGCEQHDFCVVAHGVIGFECHHLHFGYWLLVVLQSWVEEAYARCRAEEDGAVVATDGRSTGEAAGQVGIEGAEVVEPFRLLVEA